MITLPTLDLTPREIVAELDAYIVGQAAAKRAVAIALRNRFRRQRVAEDERDDILPKNILMMGPTGVGKTEIARRLAQIARAPFIKVEATKFTEVGYVGRDVESMVRDLVAVAFRLVEKERTAEVAAQAKSDARERLLDMLESAIPADWNPPEVTISEDDWHPIPSIPDDVRDAHRRKLSEDFDAGKLDSVLVEMEMEDSNNQFLQVFTPQGMEEMGIDLASLNPNLGPRRSYRPVRAVDALPMIEEQTAKGLIDSGTLAREAIVRTEQTGIIFIDEIDKVAIKSSGGSGPDVSREGVQRDLLPIIEGSTVQTKFGPCRTDHILFIAAGAFHIAKPSDLIPELQGRLPIRVTLDNLVEDDFRRILKEPKNALTKQYQKLLKIDGVDLSFTDGGLDELAKVAWWLNQNVENIGARRLHTVIEKLLEDVSFAAPESGLTNVVFDDQMVREKLGDVDHDEASTL